MDYTRKSVGFLKSWIIHLPGSLDQHSNLKEYSMIEMQEEIFLHTRARPIVQKLT
mgnify:CR=1 FL=1